MHRKQISRHSSKMAKSARAASVPIKSIYEKAVLIAQLVILSSSIQVTNAYWHYQQYYTTSTLQPSAKNEFIGPLQLRDQSQSQSQQQTLPQSHRNDMQYPEMTQISQRSTAQIIDGLVFNLRGTPINATSVKLVWNVFASQHADYFDLRWGPVPDALHSFSETLNGTTRDHIISNLQPDTQYQFEVHGVQGGFRYRPILALIRTPPPNYIKSHPQDYANPDIMPLGVRAEAKSNTTIQLTWTDKERPGSFKNSSKLNVIRYYINHPSINSTETASAPAAPQYHYVNYTNLRDTRVILQKLKPATEYAFAVKTAYHSPDMKRIFTQSTFSMDTVAKTYDIEPTAPRNFSIQFIPATRDELIAGHSDKLELSWLPPESSNGPLKGYVILYAHDRNVPDEQWVRIEVNGANINNWYVTKLTPGWSYYFKLRSVNQKGQSGDSDTRLFVAPALGPQDKMINQPIPANNILLLVIICMVAILFLLFLIVSRLACRTRKKPSKGCLQTSNNQQLRSDATSITSNAPRLNGFTSNNLSSTVTARVGTLARRRDQSSKPDFWISATEQAGDNVEEIKSEKSNNELNMAMVSIQRDAPQFATTQLAQPLPEYKFDQSQQQQILQQLQQQQQQSHYHPGQLAGALYLDKVDSATASALMTLSKRHQQQYQKYQMSNQGFAMGPPPGQLPSPHQQPPPPPPLNIEQQQQIQSQPLYGTHQSMINTRSLKVHRPTLYDPVSGSFVQSAESGPPNYNSSTGMQNIGQFGAMASNTIQYHPHQTSTLLSRRSTNTLRSFQTYGGLGGPNDSPL